MSVLSDREIRESVQIQPFACGGKRVGQISYGVSSYGYDVRLAEDVQAVSSQQWDARGGMGKHEIDPKDFDPRILQPLRVRQDDRGRHVVLPPHGFALAHTVETLIIPDDVLVICVGKSTYARCGLIVNVTPLEPGWRGQVTLELSNTTPRPCRVYVGEGICQMVFFRGNPCEVTYAGKGGKYQDQAGVVAPRVD